MRQNSTAERAHHGTGVGRANLGAQARPSCLGALLAFLAVTHVRASWGVTNFIP